MCCSGLVRGSFLLWIRFDPLRSAAHGTQSLVPFLILGFLAAAAIEWGTISWHASTIMDRERRNTYSTTSKNKVHGSKRTSEMREKSLQGVKNYQRHFLCVMWSFGWPLFCAYPLMCKFSGMKFSRIAAYPQKPWTLNPVKINSKDRSFELREHPLVPK